MKSRHIGLGLALASIAALTPVISNASPEKAALNACARAFASSLAAPGAATPTFKLAYHGNEFVGSMLEFYTREYTFDLNANDVKTGLPIARASCSTDSHGAVVALSSIPLDGPHAAVAARL
jgi:hypothetical protein